MRNRILIVAVALTSIAGESGAQVAAPAWYIRHDKVAPTMSATVTIDSATGEFLYRYTLANGKDAAQRINSFRLELPAPASSADAPAGWDALLTPRSVTWLAVGEVDPAWQPAHALDVPSFLSEIRPGAQLGGFVLRSACRSGVTPATYYVTGYDHLGVPPADDSTPTQEPAWHEDAVRGTTIAPADCATVAAGSAPIDSGTTPAITHDTMTVSARAGATDTTLTLRGYGTVRLRGGTVPPGTPISLRITRSPDVAREFDTAPVDPRARAPWELMVIVGPVRPAHPIEVILAPPATPGDGREWMPFAQMYRSTEQEVHDAFERVESSRTRTGVRFSLAPDAFTSQRRGGGLYEAIVVLSRWTSR